jgi:hypothetical protein
MSFVPPIVFDRNAHEVPAPVRLVDMFWAMYVIHFRLLANGTSGLVCPPSTPPPTSRSLLPLTACR